MAAGQRGATSSLATQMADLKISQPEERLSSLRPIGAMSSAEISGRHGDRWRRGWLWRCVGRGMLRLGLDGDFF
jgi:hypothetical protein